ncbi:putative transcription factor TFIID complex 145 kDa subunit [Aspergillus sclerotiicarbonarius CBS 121057]|uniref:Putative transcription factor TFIID complex 145 kDa subunit n=1 Tax=Aspergillus sclerotiicarbonarius (strain CBS 121057 / IBT 28362) TaxID=1448318 RepID=A0A319E5Z2_ASPSB|nr:putative transcription factor TFIID complex 145 kDa subunit [Aspergillus sclerotiicarbonarius CBS 121057]
MPHATEPPAPDAEDAAFENVMRQMNGPLGDGAISFDFLSRDLEPGEKADDAVDYEDFDDDELPEEEERTGPPAENGVEEPDDADKGLFEADEEDLFGGREDEMTQQAPRDDDLDDLFGDGPSSPGPDQADPTRDLFFEEEDEKPPEVPEPVEPPPTQPEPVPMDEEEDVPLQEDEAMSQTAEEMDPASLRAWKLQQALFAMSSYGPENVPAPPENAEELLQSLFPMFDKNALPRFLELIPHKKAFFLGKQPLKPPKPVIPSKVNIELGHDQERSFKSGGQAFKRSLEAEHSGVVTILEVAQEEEKEIKEEFDQDTDTDEVLPGGITHHDLRVVCADWDVKDDISIMDMDEPEVNDAESGEDDWLMETTRPAKKRKLGRDPLEIVALSHIDVPVIDDPQQATSRIAQKVTVDMNDPHILLDERGPESAAQKPKALGALNRDELDASVTKRLTSRYNISNDQAYDMLKQNHQNKVRSTLGNVTLEHSMPALRLQWPYYRTELAKAEARSFHRPALSFRPGQTCWFKNTAHIKRKHQRGKDVKTLYDSTKSLSLADNSNVLLVEYSEEVPLMLSNFGMSNRIINYYRRKSMEDPTRPKAEIGETAVLLPQDKSPFSIFGHVDPGEVTPAISNSMYRAPLFAHEAKNTDFLIVRSSTGSGGSDYYIRNIENLFVAGQQFPSVDVPGPHSRKVTTVAKNRMKMLVYRLLKKSPDLRLSISDVTAHIPGTSDMQNRQKVKDFLQHDKDSKYWVPMEPVPEQDVIRAWVQPEDVCLLESMQVGQQHLHDTGFGNDAETGGDDDADEEGESFEQQMAPWKATRNFLQASQGKAMLKLHGEGDPTGRGEGFSFIKTSMKGGFKAVGESVEDKLDAQRLKELGGHSYNVARQQKSYETSIRRIWDSQKASLSSTVEHSDDESDIDREEEEEFGKPTPRSEAPTPAPFRRDDETTSQFSKISMPDQRGKVLRIVRTFKDERGELYQKESMVWDPRVIRHYMQHRHRVEALTTKLDCLQPTGDKEIDARNKKLLEAELSRLNRNKERRFAREKQKGAARASAGDSPADGGSGKSAGTQRKCANCGQVGHIKTNKKCVYYNSDFLGFPSNPSEFAPSFFSSSPVAPTGPAPQVGPQTMTQEQHPKHNPEEEPEEE